MKAKVNYDDRLSAVVLHFVAAASHAVTLLQRVRSTGPFPPPKKGSLVRTRTLGGTRLGGNGNDDAAAADAASFTLATVQPSQTHEHEHEGRFGKIQ